MVQFSINGKSVEAPAGSTVLQVADREGIAIPRFCYHSKLSLAASCRMCLVEVEKAPKPMPACSTPVAEGMVVATRSPKAIASQRAVMEFLLINHPLDCPICDQGGECELQDVAMGYGSANSHYHETKRIVPDHNIGPLISTDMTRCIQCTRCVRFGAEIAGVMELGAPGRGEHMHIATFLRRGVESELSGNMIDICPVGSLTSKPFRFQARSWEMTSHTSVSPHDGVGANIRVDSRSGKVMRVVAAENEAINECWISDRDRFSYQALQHADRLTQPMIKQDGVWQAVDWDRALTFAAEGLQKVIGYHGADSISALVSPESTNEELFLAQKLMRGIGSNSIDHRLMQQDVSLQQHDPLYPSLGQSIASLQQSDATLLIGSDLRREQPLLAQRVRQSVRRGGTLALINPYATDQHIAVTHEIVVAPAGMVSQLATIAKALHAESGGELPSEHQALIHAMESTTAHQQIAQQLMQADQATILLGGLAQSHAQYGLLKQMATLCAQLCGAKFGALTQGGNAAGAALVGALPHRGPAGTLLPQPGRAITDLGSGAAKGIILMGIEPELDCIDSAAAQRGMIGAEFVVAMTAFDSSSLQRDADVMLPISTHFETAGSVVNVEGCWQRFEGCVAPPGEARPAWKVLRVLGNLFDLTGFEQLSVDDVYSEIDSLCRGGTAEAKVSWCASELAAMPMSGLQRIAPMALYSSSPLVRRAGALQQSSEGVIAHRLRINSATAQQSGVVGAERVVVQQEAVSQQVELLLDEGVPDGCFVLAAGVGESVGLGIAPDAGFTIVAAQ